MLKIQYRKIFEKDVKRAKKRGKDLEKLKKIIQLLVEEKALPAKCREHRLIGNFAQHHECHIEPDWLLIYKKVEDSIIFERTGSHADLFR